MENGLNCSFSLSVCEFIVVAYFCVHTMCVQEQCRNWSAVRANVRMEIAKFLRGIFTHFHQLDQIEKNCSYVNSAQIRYFREFSTKCKPTLQNILFGAIVKYSIPVRDKIILFRARSNYIRKNPVYFGVLSSRQLREIINTAQSIPRSFRKTINFITRLDNQY